MSPIITSDRFTTLPDERALASTVTALEEHGFSVEVVDDLDAARAAVLAELDFATQRREMKAIAAYGQRSSVGKILEIRQELPGRIHVVLVRQAVGF